MDFESEKNLKKFLNTISMDINESSLSNIRKTAFSYLKAIVIDLFKEKIEYSNHFFLSNEFSLNKYDKNLIIELIKVLDPLLDKNYEELRYLAIFLLHHDEEIRNTALDTFSRLLDKNVSLPQSIFEIVLSSILVDVKQKTAENFAIFLAKNGNKRLIDYLVENLYYEIYLKDEVLREDKNRIKLSLKSDINSYLKDWERDARFKLMLGEKITKLVASADCGEYQDALLEGKGVIEFSTCIKALIEYGENLYLPSLSGLMNRTKNETHLNWLKLLSVIQGNKEYLNDLKAIINDSADKNFPVYASYKLKTNSIDIEPNH